MRGSLRNKLTITAALAALAAFGGGAYAASQSNTNPRQAFLNDVAKRLNVTPRDLTTALQGAMFDRLAAAVAAGELTQAQADQIKQRLQQTGAVPLGGRFFGPGRLERGRSFGPGGPGGLFVGGTAAAYLGLTPAQLRDQVEGGKSLAQLAAARHKSVTGLEDAISAAVRGRLHQALADKQITSAAERQILSRLSAHLSALVNRNWSAGRLAPPPGAPGPPAPSPPRAPGPPPVY